MVKNSRSDKNEIKLERNSQWDLSLPHREDGKGHRRPKNNPLPNRQAEEVTGHLCQRSHRGKALILEHPFISFRRHCSGNLTRAEHEENDSLKHEERKNRRASRIDYFHPTPAHRGLPRQKENEPRDHQEDEQ
ncbi:hypothetical protein N9Z40_03355 [Akkermansiaceae bacterium]|nr:hypothetical protein [Akkermansiaceae bacterium]